MSVLYKALQDQARQNSRRCNQIYALLLDTPVSRLNAAIYGVSEAVPVSMNYPVKKLQIDKHQF
jgi:hypothetical protein